MLDEPVGAGLIALLSGPSLGSRVQLDLDTGATSATQVPLLRRNGRLLVRQGGVVLTDDSSAVLFRDDGSTVTLASGDGSQPLALPGPTPDELWLSSATSYVPLINLYRVSSGAFVRRVDLPPRSLVIGPAPDGRVLLSARDGGTFAFDPLTGQATRVSAGRVVAMGRTVVVEDVCQDNLSCAVFSRNLLTGQSIPLDRFVGPPLDEVFAMGVPALLSPDDHWLMAWEQGGAPFPYGATVIDLATGHTVFEREIRVPDYQLAAAWTPGSRWVLLKTREGIDAIPVAAPGQDVRHLAVPGVDLSTLATFALVPAG